MIGPVLQNQPLKWGNNPSTYTRYLDCNGGACGDNTKVQLYMGNGGAGQLWSYVGGYLKSGEKCLTPSSTTNRAAVTTLPCSNHPWQAWQWQNTPSGDGYQLRNSASNMCLEVADGADSNGAQVQLGVCDTTVSRWKPVSLGE